MHAEERPDHQVDPAYDVEAASAASWAKRVMRTMQRYGCIVSDIGAGA